MFVPRFCTSCLQAGRSILSHRMAGWLFGGLVLAITLALSFGQLRAVFGFKSLLVIWGVYLGYWAARGVLRDYRPDFYLDQLDYHPLRGEAGIRHWPGDLPCAIAFAAAILGRVVIVAAVVIALATGA